MRTQINSAQSDMERQLANKIAAILHEPPIHRNPLIDALKQSPAVSDTPIETLQGDIRAEDFHFPIQYTRSVSELDVLSILENDTPSSVTDGINVFDFEVEQGSLTPPPVPDINTAHSDFAHTTIVEKTRRARNKQRARQAGSWLITLSVTLLITAGVSVLLLGVPKSLDPQAWLTAKIFTPTATNSKTIAPATTGSLSTPDS